MNISPTLFPTNTPTTHTKNVIIHIIEAAGIILTFKNAKLIPTAKASILVATASIIISLLDKSCSSAVALNSSSDSLPSFLSSKKPFIILNPINPSNINAIQWSIDFI